MVGVLYEGMVVLVFSIGFVLFSEFYLFDVVVLIVFEVLVCIVLVLVCVLYDFL